MRVHSSHELQTVSVLLLLSAPFVVLCFGSPVTQSVSLCVWVIVWVKRTHRCTSTDYRVLVPVLTADTEQNSLGPQQCLLKTAPPADECRYYCMVPSCVVLVQWCCTVRLCTVPSVPLGRTTVVPVPATYRSAPHRLVTGKRVRYPSTAVQYLLRECPLHM